jgi:two-component system OmpR family response regulator/two-component system response regulator QseB
MRLLLIEDDEMIGRALVDGFRQSGFSVDWLRDGLSGIAAMTDGTYTAVLLDLGLPRCSGLKVLRRARVRGDYTPVLILTARDAVNERVEGLDAGADDYLVKPFEYRELEARLRAVIRRRDGHAQSLIGTESLRLDLATREMLREGKRAALSAREFALLHALLERPGGILSREQLEERMYGWDGTVTSNVVEVIIHGLRKRFGNDIIRNVRGLGWRVVKDET